MSICDEAHKMLEVAFFCEKFGWLPSQVMNERADFLQYLMTIESAKSQRRKREESNRK